MCWLRDEDVEAFIRLEGVAVRPGADLFTGRVPLVREKGGTCLDAFLNVRDESLLL